MKKEELLEIGLTEEQVAKVFAMNGKDVEAAKEKAGSQLETVKAQLSEAKATISNLEKNQTDTAAIQAELNKYKADEADRLKKEAEAAERAKTLERFRVVKGDKEFSNEYTERYVLDDFAKAIADPANTGKGDAELFAALTKDKDGVFKSAHPPVNMGSVKPTGGTMTKADIFAIKDTTERRSAMAANPHLFEM